MGQFIIAQQGVRRMAIAILLMSSLVSVSSSSLTCEPCVQMTVPPYNGTWLLEKDYNQESGCSEGCEYLVKETGIMMCRSPPNVPGPTPYTDCGSQTNPQPSVSGRDCCPAGTVRDNWNNSYAWTQAPGGGFVGPFVDLKEDDNGIWQFYKMGALKVANTEEGCPFNDGRQFDTVDGLMTFTCT